jgi:hypothetical protein
VVTGRLPCTAKDRGIFTSTTIDQITTAVTGDFIVD